MYLFLEICRLKCYAQKKLPEVPMLPKDPVILLSYVNTKLRDECESLDCFCEKYEADKAALINTLDSLDYHYNYGLNQFV